MNENIKWVFAVKGSNLVVVAFDESLFICFIKVIFVQCQFSSALWHSLWLHLACADDIFVLCFGFKRSTGHSINCISTPLWLSVYNNALQCACAMCTLFWSYIFRRRKTLYNFVPHSIHHSLRYATMCNCKLLLSYTHTTMKLLL